MDRGSDQRCCQKQKVEEVVGRYIQSHRTACPRRLHGSQMDPESEHVIAQVRLAGIVEELRSTASHDQGIKLLHPTHQSSAKNTAQNSK